MLAFSMRQRYFRSCSSLYDTISQVPTLKKTLTALPPAHMLLCFFRCENIKELEKRHQCAAAYPESEYRVSGQLIKCWVSEGTSSTQKCCSQRLWGFSARHGIGSFPLESVWLHAQSLHTEFPAISFSVRVSLGTSSSRNAALSCGGVEEGERKTNLTVRSSLHIVFCA